MKRNENKFRKKTNKDLSTHSSLETCFKRGGRNKDNRVKYKKYTTSIPYWYSLFERYGVEERHLLFAQPTKNKNNKLFYKYAAKSKF